MKINAVLGAITLGLTITSSLKANEANYQQYVIGDRAAGMGGAGTALGTALDAAYYNPAGLAYTKQRTISISASLYGWQKYKADDALYPSEDVSTTSFITVPPAMGLVFFATTNTAVGLAAFVPYRYQLSDILAFPKDNNYYNISTDDQTLWVGPSIAHAFSEEWSVGAGAYCVYRNYNSLQTVYLNHEAYAATQSLKYRTFAALLMAGVQYRPTEHWRLGLSAQAPSMAVWGNGEYQANELLVVDDEYIKLFEHADNMDAQNRTPAKFTAGIGWEEEKVFGLGLDVSWHLANSYNRLSGTYQQTGEPAIAEYANYAVVDFNIGGEYYIDRTYPIRAGFYTSRSAAPDIDLEKQNYPSPINEYGLTASIGRETEHILMSIGINYVFGSGDDYGFKMNPKTGEVSQTVSSASERQIYVFFNTSYMF